jgi:hypothetical protein
VEIEFMLSVVVALEVEVKVRGCQKDMSKKTILELML